MSTVQSQYVTNLSDQVIIPSQGNIIQVNYTRVDTLTTFVYDYRAYYENTNIHPLSLTLNNVENPNHWVLCNWYLSGESSNSSNATFIVLRNGSPISFTGSSGVGNASGATYWNADQGTWYDGDDSTTPSSKKFNYIGRIGTTGDVSYQISFRDSGAGSATFYQNRSVAGAGQANYENAVTCGVIYEISSYNGWT